MIPLVYIKEINLYSSYLRDGKKKVHPFGKRKKILFITKTNKKLKKEKTRDELLTLLTWNFLV